jgi:hypothetical protein
MQMTLQSVDNVFALFGASDSLLEFFEENDIALKVAVEFVRYEKASNEACGRKLAARYLASPMSVAQLVDERKSKKATKTQQTAPTGSRLDKLLAALQRELRQDPKTAMQELERFFRALGYYLVGCVDDEVQR